VCERLLIVDDSTAVREAYETHFTRSGFEVECAGTLKDAAERLAGSVFDGVIVDVSLSSAVGTEGLAIAAYLRQMKGNDPPVVVLTAYGEPERAEAAARLGVDVFLHKPVSLVWLERLLRARFDERGPADQHGPGTEPAIAFAG
jgi:two-component system response regulator PilR (NtrC family)